MIHCHSNQNHNCLNEKLVNANIDSPTGAVEKIIFHRVFEGKSNTKDPKPEPGLGFYERCMSLTSRSNHCVLRPFTAPKQHIDWFSLVQF